MIIPTQGVSYPRSGRGIVHRIIKECFGHKLITPNYKNDTTYGEVGGIINWAKHHDFRLGLRRRKDIQYLFQVRNPVRSIWSNFRLKPGPDKRFETFAFSSGGTQQWRGMVNKWARDTSNVFVLVYEDLLEHPLEKLVDATRFITGWEVVYPTVFKRLFHHSFLLEPQRSLEGSQYSQYHHIFDAIEEWCQDEMQFLNLPGWRDDNSV